MAKLEWLARAILRRNRPVGVVDTRGPRIQGWAYDESGERPVTVEIRIDGVSVGTAVADRYRADLVSQCPDGRCAFDFTLPSHLLDGGSRTVEVRPLGSNKPLFNGRFEARLLPTDYFSGLVRAILRSGAWSMSAIRTDAAIDIEGWCIAPAGIDDAVIRHDGRVLPLSMSDGKDDWRTPLPAGLSIRSFTGRVPYDRGAQAMAFSFGLERAFRPLQDLRLPLFAVDVPEAERRKRVDGHGIEAAFNLGGYSNATKLDAIAQRFAGRPLAGLGPVLDWGCGCGRVARFVARSGANLFGADIDGENARWCSEHIKGTFVGISAEPPTPFADDFFGAIYGLSVFTHLDRQHEQVWLKELLRIAKPGALLLLSIHGGLAAVHAGLVEHVFAPDADGFIDVGHNRDIDAVTKSTYYRNVFHQPGHIAKVWGRHFEILAIEEGIIENVQDLVVARKPL